MSQVHNWQLGREMAYPYEGAYPQRQFAFVFNINRCIACQSCTMACKSTWTFARGPFAAVRQRTVTTLEDEAEERPVVDEAAGLVMVFDGRLDNRDELSDALGIPPPERRTLADAWLALAAWKRWGGDTPPRLLGDFALAVWSARDRSLWCARDPMGVRPFFYHLSHRAFVFASELRQVLAHPLVPGDPDEATVGRILSGRLPRAGEGTLYRGVRRLPHGHALAVAPQKLNAETMFIGPTNRNVQLGDDVARLVPYGENLKRLFAPDWDEFGKRRDQWVERWNREIK